MPPGAMRLSTSGRGPWPDDGLGVELNRFKGICQVSDTSNTHQFGAVRAQAVGSAAEDAGLVGGFRLNDSQNDAFTIQ